jgi:two-component system NtrC family sensor kinase
MTALPPDMETDLRRENARLKRELDIARDRQSASAAMLRAIANTSGDAEQSLQQIAEITARLFNAPSVTFRLAEGSEWGKSINFGASSHRIRDAIPAAQRRLDGDNLPGTVYRENRQVHIPDLDNVDPAMAHWPVMAARAEGTRTVAGTPLRRQGKAIGALLVYRNGLAPFTVEELALQQTFADQAVIAIENARLFNETREALERQTATADILKVIASSPSDVQPVFEAIVINAVRLVDAFSAGVFRFVDGIVHLAAFTSTNPAGDQALRDSFPRPIADFEVFRRAYTGEVVAITNTEDQPDQPLMELARARGFRSLLHSPLMSKEASIGVIVVSRQNPGPFSAHQAQLLQTFADQAVIAIENARLFNETREALERQTATADILKVIASSPSDAQPVFDAIATSSKQLLGAFSATVFRFVDGVVNLAAYTPVSPAADKVLKTSFPRPASSLPIFDLAKRGEVVQEPDSEANPDAAMRELSRARGFRSSLFSPLMSKGTPIGLIVVTRKEPGTFADHHVQLLQTFADQAVIAIENVRLFDEVQARTEDLRESLTYQTAISNVLNVISRSPSDIQPVLDTIAETAQQLCQSEHAYIFRLDGDKYHLVAARDVQAERIAFLKDNPIVPNRGSTVGRVALERRPVHVMDALADSEYKLSLVGHGGRTILGVPLLRDGIVIGVIVLTRGVVRPFVERQIELVSTFADQALIAIENVRLFDEVQARTRDLSEALQQQTATANVLKVISRSAFDLQTVLETLVRSAAELSGSKRGVIFLRDGDLFRFQAMSYADANPEWITFLKEHPQRAGQNSAIARSIASGQIVYVPDVLADPHTALPGSALAGVRAVLAVPLLRDGRVEGVMALSRSTPGTFDARQIDLVQTFADQAVIAIENVRLFDEVQARTRDLSESLDQQTATSEVLKAISASPGELDPVFGAILENAVRLCGAKFAMLFLYEDNKFRAVGKWNLPPAWEEFLGKNAILANPKIPMGKVVLTHQSVHVVDVLTDQAYIEGYPGMIGVAELGGARTLLQVPMLKENELVGTIGIYRHEVLPFTEKQIALVQSFAAQAVIALENARLLNELRQRTNDLTESLDDLRTAQDRLVQTEKLASLGQLTAGIAHEIKNPLNFVNNFSALSAELTGELNDVLKSAALSDKIRREVDELTGMLKDNLEKVVQHGKRADSIVKNMLLHSREGSGEHRPADINALLDESLNLAYHGARAEKSEFNITLQRNFDEAAGTIEVFPQEITRVFLNLISNGFYAATKRRTENGGTAFDPILSATTRDCGDSVEICIRDNGTGIPAEVKEKMFNPFFTTKPAGEGTGLGLSMSHDIIVKQHGGTIDVETEPGEFTEFRIVLPRTSNISNKNIKQN